MSMFSLVIILGCFLGALGVLMTFFGLYFISTEDEKVTATVILVLGILLMGYGFVVHPGIVKERLVKVAEEVGANYEEKKAHEEANRKDVLRQVNRVLSVEDSLIVEEQAPGKYEVKSTGKLYSVHVDRETNELMYIISNGEFVFEVGNAQSEKSEE